MVGGLGAGLGSEVNVVGQGLEGGGAAGDFAGLQDGDGAAEVEARGKRRAGEGEAGGVVVAAGLGVIGGGQGEIAEAEFGDAGEHAAGVIGGEGGEGGRVVAGGGVIGGLGRALVVLPDADGAAADDDKQQGGAAEDDEGLVFLPKSLHAILKGRGEVGLVNLDEVTVIPGGGLGGGRRIGHGRKGGEKQVTKQIGGGA